MEQRIERIEHKLDIIVDKQTCLAIDQAGIAAATRDNTESLREHMAQTQEVRKQTQMLYEGIQAIKHSMDLNEKMRQDELNRRLKPTEQFVDRAKFLSICVVAISSAFLALLKSGLLDRIFHI